MFEDYGYLGGGWGLFGGIFMILFPLVFLFLLIWIIYTVINKESEKNPKDKEHGIKIAEERYAKGEIKKEEYEEIVKTLKKL
jgi:putative membrane protein